VTAETSPLDKIGAGSYVLLTTYRRDGTPVPTPVWVVQDGDALAVWTPTDSGKIKRIRRDPRVAVASCTFRGEPTGPAVPARAEILDAAGTDRVRGLIRRKFWLTGPLTVAMSTLRRGKAGTVGVRITL
jgi:PPOX class probable F420-dependent enzyme